MSQESADHIQYELDDKPPLPEAIPLGLQHVFAMFLGNVAPPLIIAGAVGLATGRTTFLVQMALLVAGVATLVQVFTVGPVGSNLPVMMGTSFAFVGPLVAISTQFGLPAVFGACLVGAFVEVGIGFSYDYIDRFFPPLVSGIVVMLIGLTLIPVGMDYAAGGAGAADYGSLMNIGLASLVFFVTLGLNQFFTGFLRITSVFLGILVGYIAAIALGVADFSAVAQAGWIAIPTPLEFGIAFEPSAIITIAFLYAVTAVETIGDMTGIVAAANREPTRDEIRGGLFADGIMSAIAAIFSAFPNTSFSQNVGVINFTGVLSRYVVAIGGGLLIVAGFVPKVAALVTAMPDAVLGGGALILFSTIFSSGVSIIDRDVDLNHRNTTILAVSVALGLAVEFRPDAIASFPELFQTVLGSGLIMGGISALLLNIVIPGSGDADVEPEPPADAEPSISGDGGVVDED
ncbi:uracil-xanthine permease family protein [Halococcus qingdaonensis]|uniref:uracil-xanthine permease family protein n=1 Tax=Halococcus qingdaonensis TaxID=224402 RepID=UPI00211644B3|nr:nucleobase:cation symporter-2 family protein [Halococcus qingdaonensis]